MAKTKIKPSKAIKKEKPTTNNKRKGNPVKLPKMGKNQAVKPTSKRAKGKTKFKNSDLPPFVVLNIQANQ